MVSLFLKFFHSFDELAIGLSVVLPNIVCNWTPAWWSSHFVNHSDYTPNWILLNSFTITSDPL